LLLFVSIFGPTSFYDILLRTMDSMEIIQPNVITQARYVFSDTEMKVLVYIIRRIQHEMNMNPDFGVNKDLFGHNDYKIFFYLSDIDENETNLKRVKKALKDLRHRDFEVDNERVWFNVGLINYSMYNKDVGKWEVQVSHLLMPYMVHLAKGYTTYQLETVLKLNAHAQRLYMMFSQYHDTGVFNIGADRLRDMLALNDRYEEYKTFKQRVLSDSIRRINLLFEQGLSDVAVRLHGDRKKRGAEDWDRTLEFRITYTKKVHKQIDQVKQEYMRYVANILRSVFPNDERYGNRLLGFVVENRKLKAFGDRLMRMEEEAAEQGKSLSSFGGLVRHIAEKDYGFGK